MIQKINIFYIYFTKKNDRKEVIQIHENLYKSKKKYNQIS